MEKILIIEDDKSIAKLEKDYLELNNYQVTIKDNGVEGKQEALSGEYSLILLDIMLPGMDGLTLCDEIRDEIEIPILLVSAKGEVLDRIKGLNTGGDDYITKPFEPSELVARVRAHIFRYKRLKKDSDDDIIIIKELMINKNTRQVFINEGEIHLAKLEYELLVYLAEHIGESCKREDLVREIWGFEADGDFTTLQVHIRKIREKLSQHTKASYVETVWGYGYRITNT